MCSAVQAMKPTGVIINVGRGPVIEEKALIAALKGDEREMQLRIGRVADKKIKGAALDVFTTEPLPEASCSVVAVDD